jgi:hypothetical protein
MKDFLIPRYEHASVGIPPAFHWKPWKIEIAVQFDADTLRVCPPPDHLDWNKLGGFSRGFINAKHIPDSWLSMVNSFRIGWRLNPSTDSIEFAPYQYNRGERIAVDSPLPASYIGFAPQIITSRPMDSLRSDPWFKFKIFINEGAWYKGDNMCMLSLPCDADNLPAIGMLARPYHGGNLASQTDITGRISLKVE